VLRCEESGEVYNRANALLMLALTDWGRGDTVTARQRAATALELAAPFPNRPEVPDMLLTAALLESDDGVTPRAAQLAGAFHGARRSRVSSTGIFAPAHPHKERVQTWLKRAHERHPREWEHGIRLERDQAMNLARSALAPPQTGETPGAETEAVGLTRRERQVADLVAQGLTNQQIARTLTISVRTAEGHVQAAMRKLGVQSRVQVATWVITDSDGPSSGTSHREIPDGGRVDGFRGPAW
jgi:DNA-binding CsgD family transcriptional regulator